MKTKIFISCGQNENSPRELKIAQTVGAIVHNKGFEPFLAINKQDGKSFRENIFNELSESEYFLFIDLRREQIIFENGPSYRGSLFCHQEMAVASYLEIEPAYFHETGVLREGLGRYIQCNSQAFDDEAELYKKIERQLGLWKSNWKNALTMDVDPNGPSIAHVTNGEPRGSAWYHIQIFNLHRLKHAKNCFVFLESYLDKKTRKIIFPKTVELHWAGFDFPSATILPQSWRAFDALTIFESDLNEARVYSFSTSTLYHPAILSPGEYDLTYRVVCDNFPEIRKTFSMKFTGGLTGISFVNQQPNVGLRQIVAANATIARPLSDIKQIRVEEERGF